MKKIIADIDGRDFYIKMLDPDSAFNRIQITLSHLFRERLSVLNNKNYSECFFHFLKNKGYLRSRILEVGGGLGHVAFNFIKAAKNDNFKLEKYTMYDISPSLLERQKNLNGGLISDYIQADCLTLSKHTQEFSGMILANGIIADLRSVYLSNDYSLKEKYDIDDDDFTDFDNKISDKSSGYYLHIGTFLFLREISKILKYGATAVITEYNATKINQPTLFDNHYECGINFSQVAAYAERLGFECEIVDIEEILGISSIQEFLSMDVFTSQDRIARMIPKSVQLWRRNKNLPVLAYTRESFNKMLTSEQMGFSQGDADEMVLALNDCFHSIHDPKFDFINPTTWGYKCLLLRKGERDWIKDSEPYAVQIISELCGISKEEALNRFKKSIDETTMGELSLTQMACEAFITAMFYDFIKIYGAKLINYLFFPFICSAVKGRRKNNNPSLSDTDLKKIQNIIIKMKKKARE